MQTTRVAYSLGKWIFRDGLGERFEAKNKHIRLKATALQNSGRELRGKSGQILFGALEYGVATLNICPDLSCPDFFQCGDKLLHRQRSVATNIDAAEKGDVGIHSGTV